MTRLKVIKWFDDKNLNDASMQVIKLIEEWGELVKAIDDNDMEEIIDAIGDMQVVLIGLSLILKVDYNPSGHLDGSGFVNNIYLVNDSINILFEQVLFGDKYNLDDIYYNVSRIATLYNLKMEDCLAIAYEVIKDRTGKTVDGVFKRDK